MAKIHERELAKELFLQTNLTQKQIAEKVGVGEKTMSIWAIEGEWESLKRSQNESPERIIRALYGELEEINRAIQGREEGKRFADSREADARNKIIASINRMTKEVAMPQYVSVCMKLVDFVAARNLSLAKDLSELITEFLLEKSKQI